MTRNFAGSTISTSASPIDRKAAGREETLETKMRGVRHIGAAVVAGLFLAAMAILPRPAFSQIATGSISGTVTDPSGGVVPGATVGLTNQATNVTANTTTDSKGFFDFPVLQPATYTLTVSARGFKAWQAKGITISTGSSRTLPKITLQVGATTQTVQVSANTALAPVNTGESRMTLNNTMVSQLAIEGRDAAELIKIMPGMAIDTGSLSQSPWNSLTTETNDGPVGQFSANGTQPYGGMQLTLDGGVILDTGNQGTQIANIDQNMTSEMTIRNSDFTAQYSQGPVIVSAVSKSGTDQIHGQAYIYGRNGSLNAEDSYLKAEGLTKPIDRYWYPGGNIGGPINIPHFKNKLFFFAGFEYMDQHPVGSLISVFTPTSAMRAGDFTAAELAPQASTGWETATVPCSSTSTTNYANFCGTTAGSAIVNGQIPTSLMDPNGVKYMNLFPQPNVDPTSHGGYNYEFLNQAPVNRYEGRGRIDYDMTAKSTFYVSYDRQHEIDEDPLGNPWWAPPGSVPYPSALSAITITDLWSASATHVFTPTLTNQTTFNWTSYINPLRAANPSAVTPSAAGLNITLPYSAGVAPQIPNIFSFGTWGPGSMPMFFAMGQPSGFDGGAFGAYKRVPSISDDLAWVKGTHIVKAGVYWERAGNQQTDAAWQGNEAFPQGSYEFENYAYYTSGNPMADILLGHPDTFNQYSDAPTFNMWYTEFAPYVQDQWKVTPRITLNYGLRFDHLGQWFPVGDSEGDMVWDPATCPLSTTPGPKCAGPALPGFTWHGRDSSVPISGFTSPTFYYDPRVGFAYDLFGTGKTVLRGGFGVYRYQLAYNDSSEGLSGPLGIQIFTTTCNLSSWAAISSAACLPTSPNGALPAASTGLGETADAYGDNKTPYTEDWDLALDERGPWNSLIEFMYTGNRSRNELVADSLSNVDWPAAGAYFTPDPVTGLTYCQAPYFNPAGCASGFGTSVENDYLPYDYGSIDVLTHGSYANYNALQIDWQKQTGRGVFTVNYSWSRVMGIRDGETDNGSGNGNLIDAYCLQCNYGVLAYNRSQIFNAGYVLNVPSPIPQSGNRFARGAVNGWELSGITMYQTGDPIQPLTNGNLNVTWPSGVGSGSILGTQTNAETLMPTLVCNPAGGLKSGQYFNPSCFAATTTLGQNGEIIWPNITGPGYFDTDLALYKNFHITERQALQFRVDAYNFINHPNPDFSLDTQDVDLSFANSTGGLSQTNTNKELTGSPLYTTGRRIMQFSVQYSF
jgi:hypothetical protein